MGPYNDALAVLMLVFAAITWLVLVGVAVYQIFTTSMPIGVRIGWLLGAVLLGPIGLIAWFLIGVNQTRSAEETAAV